ncbi:MAG: DUF748 domain-containing protein [Deltaproteobacteria bacterium]|nr:DUF748 domain-containing protein [Deltaproteobacteria bacterium]
MSNQSSSVSVLSHLVSAWKNLGRTGKTALILAAMLLIYTLVGFFLVPALARSILTERLTEVLNRQVSIGKIAFNPFTFRVEIHRFTVMDTNGAERFAGFDFLTADAEISHVVKPALGLAEVRLESPFLRITALGQGRFAHSDLFPEDNATAPEEAEFGTIFPFRIKDIDISNGTMVFEDRVFGVDHRVEDIRFVLPSISSLEDDREDEVRPELSFVLNASPFVLTGETLPFHDSLRTRFGLTLQDVDLTRYWAYAPIRDDLTMDSGHFALNATLDFSQDRDRGLSLIVGGLVEFTDFSLSRPGDGPVLSWDSLRIDVAEATPLDGRIDLNAVHLSRPRVVVFRSESGELNWLRYLEKLMPDPSGPTQNPARDSASETAMPLVTMTRLDLADGTLEYTDHTVGHPPLKRTLSPLSLQVRGFTTASNQSFGYALSLATSAGESMALDGSAVLSPLQADGRLDLKDLRLPDYLPLAGPDLPLALENGSASVRLAFSTRLDGNSTARIDLESLDLSDIRGNLTEPGIALGMDAIGLRNGTVQSGFNGPTEIALAVADIQNIDIFQDGETPVRSTLGGLSFNDLNLAMSGRGSDLNLANATLTEMVLIMEDGMPLAASINGLAASGLRADLEANGTSVGLEGLRLAGLAIKDPSSDKAPIRLDRADLHKALVDLSTRRIEIEAINLHELGIDAVREKNGRIDLVSLFVPTGHQTEQPAPNPDSNGTAAWLVSLKSFLLNECRVALQDRAASDPVTTVAQGLTVKVNDIVSDFSRPATFEASVELSSGGRLSSQGSLTLNPLHTQGQARLEHLEMNPFQGYIPKDILLTIASGRLGAAIQWDLEENRRNAETLSGRVSGGLALEDLSVRSRRNSAELARLLKLDVVDVSLGLAPNTLDIGTVSLLEPWAGLIMNPDGTLNIVRALNPGPVQEVENKAKDPEGRPEEKPFFERTTVGRLVVNKGGLDYQDQTVEPAFAMAVKDLEVAVDNVGLAEDRPASLEAMARLDSGAAVTINGRIDPLSTPLFADLTIGLNDLDMSSLSPYTAKFIAYPIDQGQLNWSGNIVTKDNALDSKNDLLIRRMLLGKKVDAPDAPNIPIKLGLALLQDLNGDMALNLPISGQLDDPSFSVGSIVFKAIVNLFTKIVAAPFSILGSLIGGGPDLNVLVFEPGQSALTEEDRTKLDEIAKALTQRPALNLTVTGVADEQADLQALEELAFQRTVKAPVFERLQKRGEAPATVFDVEFTDEDAYVAALWDAYKEAPGDKPKNFLGFHEEVSVEDMERVVRQSLPVSGNDLVRLAEERARMAREYFLSHQEIAPNRVFTSRPQVKAGKEGENTARVELGLGN